MLLLAVAAGCGSAPETPAPEPDVHQLRSVSPSVLVVLWDTVRADHTSLHGYPRPTTPRLEAFARDAAVYEQAVSPSMWTVPAHGSLFTGLPASSHGARAGWTWLDGHHVTLAEHLGSYGYETWAWSTNPYLSEHTNLLQGFSTVRYAWRGEDAAACGAATAAKLLPEDRSTELSPAFVPTPGRRGWPEHLVAYKDCAGHAVDAFLAWQDGLPGDRPYFAYLNLLEAHHPRVPSRASREVVAEPAVVEGSLRADTSLFRQMSAMEGEGMLTEDERAGLVAAYDATLRDLDDATGRLIDALRERGRLDDTLIVVLSDHGENLGERGMYEHRWDLHQTLVHVPLVVRLPGSVEPGRYAAPVSTGHLYGTVLALTGLPAPGDAQGPLPPFGAERLVFSELVAPVPRLPEVTAAWPDLVKGRWDRRYRKVVDWPWALLEADDGWRGLYDLSVDPGETTELGARNPGEVRRLLGELDGFEDRRPAYDATRRAPEDRPGTPLRPEEEGLLEALGYLDPAGEP